MSVFVPCETADAAGWVTDGVYPRLGHRVTSLVPAGFEAYIRVLFPFDGERDAPVPWQQVADEAGIPLRPLTTSDELLNSIPETRRRQLHLDLPHPGHMPRSIAETLAGVLAERTTTPDRCYFAVWDGKGGLAPSGGFGASFTTPARRWLLYTATVADAVDGFDTESGVVTIPPHLWWPADRRWYVISELDVCCAYIGCSADTAAALLGSGLEAFAVEPADPPVG